MNKNSPLSNKNFYGNSNQTGIYNDKKRKTRILIICALGIGNTLLADPMVRHLKKNMPDADFFLLAGVPGTENILPRSVKFSGIWRLPVREMQTNGITLSSITKMVKTIHLIKKMNFDITITTIPSNRVIWNVIAYYLGAKIRIIHEYPNRRHKTFFFLQNKRVPICPGIHDIQQNLNLLKPLGIALPAEPQQMQIVLTSEEIEYGRLCLKKLKILNPQLKIFAFHVGCDPNAPRRWSLERYAQLIKRIAVNHDNIRFLINAGPAEVEDSRLLAEKLSSIEHPPYVVTPDNIFHAAGILKFCTLLISNDSGVMHVGAALGIQVLSIFGPSDNIRMAPYQDQNNVVCTDDSCRPCTTTLKNIGDKFACSRPHYDCWENLTVDMVYDKLVRHL